MKEAYSGPVDYTACFMPPSLEETLGDQVSNIKDFAFPTNHNINVVHIPHKLRNLLKSHAIFMLWDFKSHIYHAKDKTLFQFYCVFDRASLDETKYKVKSCDTFYEIYMC